MPRLDDDYRARDTLVHKGRHIEAGEKFPLPPSLPDNDEIPKVGIDGRFIYGGRLWSIRSGKVMAPGTIEAHCLVDCRSPVDDLVAKGLLCPPGGCDDPACASVHGGADA